jgi:hypothetical protein
MPDESPLAGAAGFFLPRLAVRRHFSLKNPLPSSNMAGGPGGHKYR